MTFKSLVLLLVLINGCTIGRARALIVTEPSHTDRWGLVVPSRAAATRSTASCQSLLVREITFGAVGVGASFLGGAGGLTAAFQPTDDWRYVLGGISLITGVMGAVFSFLSSTYVSQFSAGCTTATVGN